MQDLKKDGLIQGIKDCRQWTEEVFGVKSGLKETKDFIEHIRSKQEGERIMIEGLPPLTPFQKYLLTQDAGYVKFEE